MPKYKLIIFETNNKDGIMSKSKKFYPSLYTSEDIYNSLLESRLKAGKKYHFNGLKMLQPLQKDVEPAIDYLDGTYKKIDESNLIKEDLWEEKIPADILLIDSNYPNIVVGHRMADCPILIVEDRKNNITAVSHCGATQINRKVPMYTVEALQQEANSQPEDLYVYIGSCIKKESYVYDSYPSWATNKAVWDNCIELKKGFYHIDLVQAIIKQLNISKENITVSPYDTYTNPNYYSHLSEIRKEAKPKGQNFVGCFYKEVK